METDTGVRPLLSRRGVIGCAGHKVGRPNCNTKQKKTCGGKQLHFQQKKKKNKKKQKLLATQF